MPSTDNNKPLPIVACSEMYGWNAHRSGAFQIRRAKRVRLPDHDHDRNNSVFSIGRDHCVTMNTTPTWNINQGARIGADDFESIAGIQVLDSVLSLDNWHGAQHASCVKFKMVFRHARS